MLFGLLSLKVDPQRLNALAQLLLSVIKLELIEFSCSDLTLQEVFFHLHLFMPLLKSDKLLLLDPDAIVDTGALSVQIISFFLHRL